MRAPRPSRYYPLHRSYGAEVILEQQPRRRGGVVLNWSLFRAPWLNLAVRRSSLQIKGLLRVSITSCLCHVSALPVCFDGWNIRLRGCDTNPLQSVSLQACRQPPQTPPLLNSSPTSPHPQWFTRPPKLHSDMRARGRVCLPGPFPLWLRKRFRI